MGVQLCREVVNHLKDSEPYSRVRGEAAAVIRSRVWWDLMCTCIFKGHSGCQVGGASSWEISAVIQDMRRFSWPSGALSGAAAQAVGQLLSMFQVPQGQRIGHGWAPLISQTEQMCF